MSLVLRFLVLVLAVQLAACGVMRHDVLSSAGASANAADHLGAIRSAHGLTPAVADARLEQAAEEQARYMAETARMVHTTGYGRDFGSRMKANGIRGAAAENIAHGGMEMTKLFRMWTESAPHRRNMLDPRFGRFGLASATAADGRRYWALVLGE